MSLLVAMSTSSQFQVVVTATGMVSVLGRDVDTTCASARAGIRRLVELETSVYDEESGELVPVAGNAISGFTDGFIGPARITRLIASALEDLLARANLGPNELARTSLHICLPAGYYYLADMRRSIQEIEPPNVVEQTIRDEREHYQEQFRQILTRSIGVVARLGESPPPIRLYFGDQAGIVEAIRDVQALLANRTADRCIIGGADSLVDEEVIGFLDRLELLKTPIRPFGTIPGEAAAFFMLERGDAAKARGLTSLASIAFPEQRRDIDADRFSRDGGQGRALMEAAVASIRMIQQAGAPLSRLITPLNGDVWKAIEWGHTLTHLPEGAREIPQWTPAETLGDVGAAAGAAAVCLSTAAFRRGYSAAGVLVCLSSYSGEKGAFFITN